MKKFVFALVLIIGLSASLLAQPRPGQNRGNQGRNEGNNPRNRELTDKERAKLEKEMNERRHKMMLEALKLIAKKYNLTEEQTEQLVKVFTELFEMQAKLQEKMKKEMKELENKHEEELKALLGDKYDDFKKEMEKLRKANEPRRVERREEKAPSPDRIAKMLELNEEQTKKFIEAFNNTMKQLQKLGEEAVKNGWKPEKIQKKIEAVYAELDKVLKEILTVNQWEKFSKMRERIFPAPAENPRTQRIERFQILDVRKFINELGLSDTQKKDLEKVFKKFEKDRADLMETMKGGDVDRRAIAEKMRELAENFEAELKKILTEEQQKKLQELRKKAAKDMRDNADRPQRRMGFERILGELELSEEQQKAIKAILEDHRKAMDKLREERGNPEEMREKMQALMDEVLEKIKAQLTEEQKKKLEEMKEKMQDFRENRGDRNQPGRPDGPRNPDKPDRPDRPENPENPERPERPESPALPR